MRQAARLAFIRSNGAIDDDSFRRLVRARDFIAANHREALTLDAEARHACLSPFHFQRQFVRAFGETPHEFLTRVRIDRARELLTRSDLAVTDVCLDLGYSSLGSFSLRFQTLTGKSPSQFRREARRVFPVPAVAWARFIPACYLLRFGVHAR